MAEQIESRDEIIFRSTVKTICLQLEFKFLSFRLGFSLVRSSQVTRNIYKQRLYINDNQLVQLLTYLHNAAES